MARIIEHLEGLTDMSRLVSFSFGIIRGGEFVNVVPLSCSAEVLAVADSVENLAYVRQVMADLGRQVPEVRVEVAPGPERPLFLPSDGTRCLFAAAQKIAGGLGLSLKARAAGGGSDGNFTCALGVPTLDGIGVAGRGPHTHGECLEISTLGVRAHLIGSLIRQIGLGEVPLPRMTAATR